MAREILYREHARNPMKIGVDKLADAVRETLGPKGRNVVIDQGLNPTIVTKDGVTVAKNVMLKDPLEALGAKLVLEAASKTNDVAGDGTTTATVLARALISEGLKNVTVGANPLSVKRGMEAAMRAVVNKIKEIARPVEGAMIEQVASISANDKAIGSMIAKAIAELGDEAVLTVEEHQLFGLDLETVKGLRVDRGLVAPHMVTDPERGEACLDNVPVLVVDRKLVLATDVMPILEIVAKSGKNSLVIVAHDVTGEALATLVVNKLRGVFTAVAIKAPGYGDEQREMLQDVATVTGATLISEAYGRKHDAVKLEDLGSVRRFVANKENSTFVGGAGEKDAIDARITKLRTEKENAKFQLDKEHLDDRIGKLAGGVGVIKVGAATETELREVRYRIEDAIAATKAAIQEGVVVGGGVALVRARAAALSVDLQDKDERTGAQIVYEAATEPIKAIAENAGKHGFSILEKVEDAELNTGYDASTGEICDLFERGIIDPAKVTRCALENAVSAASLFLTTSCAIVEEVKKKEEKTA